MQVRCRRVLVGGFDTVPGAQWRLECCVSCDIEYLVIRNIQSCVCRSVWCCFLPAIELEVRQRTAVAVGVVAGDSPDWDLGMVGIALWEWMRSSAVSARGTEVEL